MKVVQYLLVNNFFNFIKNKVPFINLLTNLIYISIWIYGFVNLMSMGKITKEKLLLYGCADVVRFSFWWHPLLHSIGQFRIWIRIRNTVTINYLVGSGSGKKKTRTQSASSALFAILFSTQEILRFNISIKITTGKKKTSDPWKLVGTQQ